ncbi:MAG: peptide chain release factor N(5)-glutamine methyltransferase [Alphaproteobacteria bacterium]
MSAGSASALKAEAVRALEAAGIANPRLDARLLLAACLGEEGSECGKSRARLAPMLARRIAGEPVSRILGSREFWSLDFELSPATLDPRPDSETLIEAALARIAEPDKPLRIADLGTGTGCLLLALLSELPEASGVGVDIDAGAARVAAGNAKRLGLAGRASFVVGDWGAGLAPEFDCVLSNPPYIPSADIAGLAPEVRCDPPAALDGGRDGLDGIRGAARGAARLLKSGGLALIEIGAGQEQPAAEIVGRAGLRFVTMDKDLAGHPRVVVALAGEKGQSAFTIR